MPAYSFSHNKFVALILSKRKPHTIRPRRKNQIRPGDVLTLYFKQRTPVCRAIALTVCTKVEPVVIYVETRFVKVNGRLLSIDKTRKLAMADGFSSVDDFFEFFERYGKPVLDNFDLIHWDTEKFINLWDVDTFQRLLKGLSAKERLGWLEASYNVQAGM